MADYTQSATQSLLAHQEITHPANVVGSAVDCSTWLAVQIVAWLANIETTANLTSVNIIIQGSIETSGNDWFDIMRFSGSTTAAVDDVFGENEAIGETVIALASTTGYTVGRLVYIKDATSIATSEWGEVVKIVTNTSITLMDGLIVAKVATDDIVYSQAERFSVCVDCSGLKRIRACVLHQSATGSTIRVKCDGVAATDIE